MIVLSELIELRDVIKGKHESVVRQDYDTAAILRDKERILRRKSGITLTLKDLELEIKKEIRDEVISDILE